MIRQTPRQKQAFRRAANSRGRLYLQTQLPWLDGFPISQTAKTVTFMMLPQHDAKRPFTVKIGREALHTATFASKRIAQRLPRQIAGLVKEPAAWQQGVPQLIALLKTAVHQQQPLPKSVHDIPSLYPSKAARQFESMLAQHPALQPLLHALSWVTALTPANLPPALNWIAQNSPLLRQLLAHQGQPNGIIDGLMLWQIAQQDGSRRLQPLLSWFGNPLAYTVATVDAEELLNRWISGLQSKKQIGKLQTLEKRPSPVTFTGLHKLLVWLHGCDKNSRRRALTLFELVAMPDLLTEWADWWAMVMPHLERAQQLDLERQYAPKGKIDSIKIKSSVDQLIKLRQKRPSYFHWDQLHSALQLIAAPENVPLDQAIASLLPHIPPRFESSPTRHALLNLFLALDQKYQRNSLLELLTIWRRYRQQQPQTEADLHLLRTIFVRWHQGGFTPYWTFLSRFLNAETPLALLPETFEAWTLCQKALAAKQLEELDQELISNLQQATRNVEKTADYYKALVRAGRHEEYYGQKQFELAHLLSQETVDFLQLLNVLQKLANRNYADFAKLSDLLQLLATQSWFQLAHDSLLNPEHLALLIQIATLRQALSQMKDPTPLPLHPIPTQTPSWCSRYPISFHPLLSALATLTSEAEAKIERVLGKQFPNPKLVRQEIEAISAQLAKNEASDKRERLERRLANLQQRLRVKTAVSPQKMGNLEKKLLQLLHYIILKSWHDALVERARSKMSQLFGLDDLPNWFWQPQQLEIIAPMLDLAPAFRSLGIQLFRERVGPPPWGLHHHPANEAFIGKLQKKGINMNAWLTPPPPQTFTAPTGQTVTLTLCNDPLKIFHMGSHFRTCLSAGSFNFFSVFANAADVNKQVILGHNAKGQVVGRCLMALTNDGAILTFEPYSHDPKLEFRGMVKEWVLELAQQMKTAVLPEGHVSNLVATDWYDDGSIDIAQQFEFLNEGSDFRQQLAKLPINQFLPKLQANFAPLPLNAFTLPLVVGLRELQKRPALIVPLMPAIIACKQLPTHVLIRIASLAYATGEHAFARQIMQAMSLTPILEAYRLYEWLDHQTMLGLATFAPSTTLRVLRRTRPSKVRQDVEETHPHRVEQYAVAYEALGRPNRAQTMRQRLKALRQTHP